MITPATSIQIPRRIAQATRLAISPLIISLEFVGCFFETWNKVYPLERKTSSNSAWLPSNL